MSIATFTRSQSVIYVLNLNKHSFINSQLLEYKSLVNRNQRGSKKNKFIGSELMNLNRETKLSFRFICYLYRKNHGPKETAFGICIVWMTATHNDMIFITFTLKMLNLNMSYWPDRGTVNCLRWRSVLDLWQIFQSCMRRDSRLWFSPLLSDVSPTASVLFWTYLPFPCVPWFASSSAQALRRKRNINYDEDDGRLPKCTHFMVIIFLPCFDLLYFAGA